MRRKNHFYIIAFAAILSAMLAGNVLLSEACRIPFPLKVKVQFIPDRYHREAPPPCTWKVYIWVIGPFHRYQIDTTTIMLEGELSPVKTKHSFCGYIAYFDVNKVIDLLLQKCVHLGLPSRKCCYVPLTVTGKLTTGADWSGTDTIRVFI